ncbi:hypothetical protein BGZ65_010518 [Modicella reniformis]|uniref:Uncharacterized protein n=1 Tax=Modicella reniformis TaxID=1440133 RepID=A0A9P6MDH2_9FUNG|nr:hypothetical protein BGZ65_010518 [Modicella reniformis]
MTAHRGYTIKYPRPFQHRHRGAIKRVARVTKHVVRSVETAAGFVVNVASHPGNVAASALASLHRTADNRARLNRAGIDPDNLFSAQVVSDTHQKRAIEELLRDAANMNGHPNITGDLRGIVLENGRIILVCDRHRLHRDLYQAIRYNKMIIHIEPEYFEARERAGGTRFISIVHLFNDLGQIILQQKALTHLEIHGNSADSGVYAGLQAVLKLSSLETLHISGIPSFFQGKDTFMIPMKCRRLKDLALQGVLVNTEQAATNLRVLIEKTPDLMRLKVTLRQDSI